MAVVLYCGGAIVSPPPSVGYRSVQAVNTILQVLRHFGFDALSATTSFDTCWQHPESDDRPPPHVEVDDVKLCGLH